MKFIFSFLVFALFSVKASANVNVWAPFTGVYKVVSVVSDGSSQEPHTAKIVVGGVTDAWFLTWWNPAPGGTATQRLEIYQDPSQACAEPLKSCSLQTSAQINPGKIQQTYIRTYEGVTYDDQIITFEDKGSGSFEMVEVWKTGNASIQVYTLQKE